MCSPITCRACGKTGWTGCGAHVEQVLRGLPQEKRCVCNPGRPSEGSGIMSGLSALLRRLGSRE